MFPLMAIGPALSLAGGLFGSRPSYGSAGDLSAARGYMGQEAGIGRQYGQQSQDALNEYGTDNAGYRQAAGAYGNYLKQDPFTDSYDTAQLAGATNGAAQSYQRANANLSANMASRGLTDSSEMAGGLAGIGAAQAGSMATTQNALAMNRIAQRRQNLATLTGLTGGMANTDYSRGMGALGAQEGIDSHLAGMSLGMGEREQGMELQQGSLLRSAMGAGASGIANAYGYQQWNQEHPGGFSGMFPMGSGQGGGAGGGAGGDPTTPGGMLGLMDNWNRSGSNGAGQAFSLGF